MSSLTATEKSKFERLLGMSTGYVSNFSDSAFGALVADVVGLDIHSEKYRNLGTSKAKKLRSFWEQEDDYTVGKLMEELVRHTEGLPPLYGENVSERQALYEPCKAIISRLKTGAPNLDHLKNLAMVFDAKYLAEQIRRLEHSVQTDPALAIGTAKELIETCCKTILTERGRPLSGTPDIPILTKETLKELKLVPEGVPDEAKGADLVRRLLQNLGAIGNNLAELRGLYGTGHGKHGKSSSLSVRHAKLAVGCAATLASFLFDTHSEMISSTNRETTDA